MLALVSFHHKLIVGGACGIGGGGFVGIPPRRGKFRTLGEGGLHLL
nr:MAG TPA: hypothetical protein [Caudoviricetes sp.]